MGQSQTKLIDSPGGPVELRTYVRPDDMQDLELDEGIGVFGRYRSILTSMDSLTKQADNPETNLCLALHEGRRIVGYAVRRPPEPEERWAEMQPPILHELFGENSRGWRGQGLMKPMLELVVGEPANEARIIYIVGYSWHWDLDETHKTLTQYRDTIIHLLTPLGFRQYPTNEPNVSLRSENLFMARLGAEAAADKTIKRRFTNLLFGIQEDE